jgi:nicotinamide mononucleotide (NMN) deamidase PncC
MATGVLNNTPQASLAASVTGHLGPDAPPEQDGTAWATIALRAASGITLSSTRLSLPDRPADAGVPATDGIDLRHLRQIAAANQVLRLCLEALQTQT